MTRPNVLGFLAAPDRETTLHAVAIAFGKVRQSGVTYKEMAKVLECCDDTIANAVSEKSLLSFDVVARLCYFWPDHCAAIMQLWAPGVAEPSTADRLDRIEREVLALRRVA